jgi:hypothetical protein
MIKIIQSNNISDPSEINLMYEFASRGKNFLEKSSFVEKMENLPGESNKVRINANVCKLNGKSAKNIARKSGKRKRSKNPPNWIRKGSVVFIRSQRDPPTHCLVKCALGNEI